LLFHQPQANPVSPRVNLQSGDVTDGNSDAFKSIITITVGEGHGARDFQVYRGLLSHHSQFFKRFLLGTLKNSNSHSLPHDDVGVFQIFYDWLNSGELSGENEADLTVDEIIDTYVFGEFYMVQELKDRALDLYLLHFFKNWTALRPYTSKIYTNTSPEFSLRKLHVDILIETFEFEDLRVWSNDDPKDFLVDIMEICREKNLVLGSCPGLADGIAHWKEVNKAVFCQMYHEHPRLESYPAFEPTSEPA
jgi:hypothetical protein